MENEFVTYDIALRLKALGYNDPCIAFHSKIYGLLHTSPTQKVNEIAGEVLAPTWQTAFSWFRKKYDFLEFIGDDFMGYSFSISKNSKPQGSISKVYNTYEEAQEACLEKLCEIIELKNK